MSIRLMRPSDYDQVYALWQQDSGVGLRRLDDSRPGIEQFLARNPRTCFVAVDETDPDRLIGVILGGHDGRRGHIYHLLVDEGFRHRGLGHQLVEAVVAAMRQEGIHRLAITVFRANALGNRFWAKEGFKERPDLVYRNRSINKAND